MQLHNSIQLVFVFCIHTLVGLDCVTSRQKVLLVSFDGFRYDYFGKYATPNFDFVANTGVRAQFGVRTAFVTKTFPDHYTIATGLYEESHGIVSNSMYDPLFNETFNIRNTESKWWDDGEPIWTTAKLQGVKVGTYFWPGSNVQLKNILPDLSLVYNKSISFKMRVDTAIHWLLKENAELVLLYFHEPDSAGHQYGVFSSGVEEAVKAVDDTLGYILEKLKSSNLLEEINLILVSDHGMTNITLDSNHIIVLNDYISLEDDIQIIPDFGAVAAIMPIKGRETSVYDRLKNAHPNMTVYRKQDIPDRFHYKNHRRIMPIIAVADEGYFIVTRTPTPEDFAKSKIGQHGYDNRLRSMRPLFLARGPSFKKNFTINSVFETVNIYPMLCHVLDIRPASNNGSLENVQNVFYNNAPASLPTLSTTILLYYVVSCSSRFY